MIHLPFRQSNRKFTADTPHQSPAVTASPQGEASKYAIILQEVHIYGF